MEETGCEIICGAPTTLAVKGMMMMMIAMTEDQKKQRAARSKELAGTFWPDGNTVTGDNICIYFNASLTSSSIRCWWTKINPDRWCFVQDFRAESDILL